MDLQNKKGMLCDFIITDEVIPEILKNRVEDNEIEIKKIKRPNYEIIEENNELLTEEEKEFLQNIGKYYQIVRIEFGNDVIYFFSRYRVVACIDFPPNLKFEDVEQGKKYTTEELGIKI